MIDRFLRTGLAAALLGGCLDTHAAELEVVPQVDLERYQGVWYEIARLPNRFQEGCTRTTAEYELRDNGKVRVINRCTDASSGKAKEAAGWAKVKDPTTNAKLAVTFFWPFYGDYYVLALDDDYTHVLVGEPKRRYLWILARSPELDAQTYDALVALARDRGFDTSQLLRTSHEG